MARRRLPWLRFGRAPTGAALARRFAGHNRASVLARRARSVPTCAVLWIVLALASPVLVGGAGLVDLARRRGRMPTARALLFLWLWLSLDLVASFVSAVLWVGFGAGRHLEGPASRWAHHHLQLWLVDRVADAARVLGLRFDVEHRDPVEPGPLVVLARHASYADAILPALLFGCRAGFGLRYVLAAELRWDPMFDIVGARLPDHFLDRSAHGRRTIDHRGALVELAAGLNEHEAVCIFPEGRFFSRSRLERAVERIRRDDPERGARVSTLTNVLPVRPAGALSLLQAAPGADVVFVAHVGLERFDSIRSILRNVPLRRPVRVTTWRIPRTEVPTDSDALARWLDDRWAEVDDLVRSGLDATG